ncbi:MULTISPECIES: hypothetical protein [unclassified Streptomyces]|nr:MULTISPECIES: hypothetical protein [unclassified Streptomyces]MCX4880549.1 hypothetical protein [Streptomyces sp. NBC_00847]MCX5420530.1 hypothetical protein [Streptomyces sp. NBC_00078]
MHTTTTVLAHRALVAGLALAGLLLDHAKGELAQVGQALITMAHASRG